MSGLDFVLVATSDAGYEVWTPDQTGACIGAGTTPSGALNSTLATLEATAAAIHEQLETGEYNF